MSFTQNYENPWGDNTDCLNTLAATCPSLFISSNFNFVIDRLEMAERKQST